ncbi:MAG: 2-succinylbenzoate--CoA ligase [Microcoleaceae cyanobacterium]
MENKVEQASSLLNIPQNSLLKITQSSLLNFSLIGYNNQLLYNLFLQRWQELTQLQTEEKKLKIFLAERETVPFLAGFLAAFAANCEIFLCNPNWGQEEWKQVFNLVKPDIIFTEDKQLNTRHNSDNQTENNYNYRFPITDSPMMMIPTGGTSGKIRFAMHTGETLMASIEGFKQYFQVEQINSFCLLPLYHVSGLMQFLRSFTTQGKLVITPWKNLEIDDFSQIKLSEFFISLVPTQLQRLLHNREMTSWLSQFQTVLLGGAPPWQQLLETAREHKIRLAPTYGMTETASQIATLKPDDFLGGYDNAGQILPHANIIICNENGENLGDNQRGIITIKSKSLALGYYPQLWENRDQFKTDDLGFIDSKGYLHILGRNSDKIITGGENVFPAEVEAAIKSTGLVADICIIGLPDQEWGQVITAVYVPINPEVTLEALQGAIASQLSKYKQPRKWLKISEIPRNAQGKVNRETLHKLVEEERRSNKPLRH